jgi:hypothetical protein
MPRLPSTADQERPIPRGRKGVVTIDAGALKEQKLPGLALARLGEDVTTTALQFENVLQREQDRLDRTRAEEAFNRLRDKQLDLTVGEKDGFTLRKGADAINKPILQEYATRLEDAARGISDGLTNDRQREYFRPRAAIVGLQFKEDILKHIGRENNAYAEQVFRGTIDTEVRNATVRWDSPDAIGLSLERINSAINTEARRAGWSPEITEAQRLAAAGKLHTAVLGQAIGTENYAFAQKYFETNKAAIPPETARVVQKVVEDGTQKQIASGYRNDFINLRDDPKALDRLGTRITGDKRLDLDRQNALLGPIASRIETLQHKQEIATQRQLNLIQKGINNLNSRTLAGYEPSFEEFAPYIATTKGTELEGEVKQALRLAAATRDFRLSTPTRQETMLNEIEARTRSDPASVDYKVLGHLKTIHENQQRQLKEAPVAFAYRQGLAEPVKIDFSNPAAESERIIARVSVARGMNQVYGADLKPLLPDELSDIRARLERAKPEEKMAWFGSLRASVGGDPTGYSAMMTQLAPDDPALAMAGEYAGKGRTESARLILDGQTLIRPARKADGTPDQGKLWPMPPDTDIRRRFQSDEGDAFAGNAKYRNMAEQATKAIYAKLSEEAGDASGVLNSSRFDQAFKLATGGVDSYRGRSIILPYGMEFSDFRRGLNTRIENIVGTGRLAEGVSASQLRDMPLDAIGDGRYVFRSGNGYLVDKSGQRIIVNFNLEPNETTIGGRQMGRPMGRGAERMIAPWERPMPREVVE